MTYEIVFTELRTYLHTVCVDAESVDDAMRIANRLEKSTPFIWDYAGNGSYEETEFEVGYVEACEAGSDYVLTADELKKYMEG